MGMDRLREQASPSMASRADEAGVHPVYFTRAFRAAFNRSPGAVARGARLERAAVELLRCNAPVAAIAHRAGFADHSHFCRQFRQSFAMTPLQSRRRFGDQTS